MKESQERQTPNKMVEDRVNEKFSKYVIDVKLEEINQLIIQKNELIDTLSEININQDKIRDIGLQILEVDRTIYLIGKEIEKMQKKD
jgi:hypothetical protein